MHKKLKGLAPVVDRNSRVLILGSFPGPLSLAKRQYYAYPQNQFWKLVFGVLGAEDPVDYRARLAALKRNHVALWDIISSCHRHDASDSNICKSAFNDIASLLKRYPRIRAVFCNGGKSYSVYNAQYKDLGLPVTYLPSTSPAHAGMTIARKKKIWRAIPKACNPRGRKR